MNRRGFLGLLAAAPVAYFFAPKGGWGIVEPTDEELTKYIFTGRNVHISKTIEEAMAQREKYMRDMVVRANVTFNGLQMADPYPPSTSGQYLGISREGWTA